MIIKEGTDAAAVTAEQVAEVAKDVELFIRTWRSAGVNNRTVAQAIGYSPGVLSEFIKGTYAGNRGQVALDLQSWLIEEEQRRSRPETTQFVWTDVAMMIKGVANYCLDKKKIGLVYGPDTAGVGKTTSLRAIHQDLGARRSALITLDKVDASPTGLLRKICKGVGVQDSGSNNQRFNRVADHLRGRSHLLLIDQVHSLRGAAEDRPLYILADLYDQTQTAQLWCGTADMVAYLERQRARGHDESLAQIRRRIFPCVDLMESVRTDGGSGEPLATVEQVREMFARNKLRLTQAAARFLCTLINTPDSGGIGLCVQIVEYATMLAERSDATSLDVPLLKSALQRGFMPARADVLLRKCEEPRRAAVG